MKKIYNALVIILFSTTSINFVTARVRSPQEQQAQQQQKTIVEDTKKLKAELKKAKAAKTAEQKKKAEQDIYTTAQRLLLDLKDERSYMGDIYSGYTEKQVIKARANIEELVPIKQTLENTIKKQQAELDEMTDKGWIFNSTKSGKEKEYEKLSLLLTKNKNALKRIDGAIRGQSIIAGEAWSNAFLALGAATAATTLLTGAAVYVYGGTAALAGVTSAASTVYKKGQEAATWVKGAGVGTWDRATWLAEYGRAAADALSSLRDRYLITRKLLSDAQMAVEDAQKFYDQLGEDADTEERETAKEDIKIKQATLKIAKKQETFARKRKEDYEKSLRAKSKK
jgi:hypothetical protein